MKSAYELALERMEAQGIDRPDAGALSEADRDAMADIRSRAEAKLAELEILHQEALAKASSLGEREAAEETYRIDRRRIEDQRDAKLAAVRTAAGERS
ncbi:MAG: hypothetical protein AAGE94_01170 [Acidobacteriota bacterium]